MVAAQVFVPNSSAKMELYPFTEELEEVLVTLLAQRPKFFGRLGPVLDPRGLSSKVAKLALEAVRAVAYDSGRGPEKTLLVVQRVRRWMDDGKLTQDDVDAVSDLFDRCEDAGLPSEEAVAAEVVPVLSRRMQREAIESALTDWQKRADPAASFALLEKATRMGETEEVTSTLLGEGSFESMDRMRQVDKIASGVMEVDEALEGGFYRGTLTVYVAPTGGGKSQALVQHATAAALRGMFVGYVSLELPEPIIFARLKGNMTGLLVNDITANPSSARSLLAKYTVSPYYGGIAVGEFTPKVTTVADIRAWVKATEEKHGRRMDVVVVDYADRIGPGKAYKKSKGEPEDSTYASSLDVYEELRIWVNTERRWGFTASQSTRAKDKGKKLGVDDVADSMHKVRVADYVITLNPRDEGATLLWVIAKNRLGKSGQTLGPLPVQFECGRVGPITYPDWTFEGTPGLLDPTVKFF